MIKYPKKFRQSISAGFDGIFDWDFLLPAFVGTKIEPMDIDAIIERHGKFLIIETKTPGKKIPEGQEITLKSLLQLGKGYICIFILYGKMADAINEIEEWTLHNGKINIERTQCDSDYVVRRVTTWFKWANST